MSPQNLRYGGGVAGTVLNPVVAIVLLLTGVLICCLPQRKAIVPFIVSSILIPGDQIIVLAGLHFPVLRLLILFGMIRILIIKGRGNWDVFSGGINKIDKAVILLAMTSAIAGVLLFQVWGAVLNQLGELYTAFCTYFLLRCLIRNREDVHRVIRAFAWVTVVVALVMVYEQLTGHNPYALLGGARAHYFTTAMQRDGRIRATGSFGTPILAGTFGAVLLPLFIGVWLCDRKQRGTAIVGMLGATMMVAASNSSTPVMGTMAGLLGLCLWPVRGMMRIIRWGIAVILVTLHLVMKAPVWHLITRLDISGSSYHRYALIDQCIQHFWDWWLIGTKSNADWGWDMWDTANQYVATAISGGLLSLIIFVAIIVYGFKYLGNARRAATDKKQALFLWGVGSALFAYVVSFFGISYWDQSVVAWYALLAMISAVAVWRKADATVRQFQFGLEEFTSSPAARDAAPMSCLGPWSPAGPRIKADAQSQNGDPKSPWTFPSSL